MSTRTAHTEPFHSGSSSASPREKKGESLKVTSNASQSPSADPATGIDHLSAALATRTPLLPSDTHRYTHTTTIEPVGARYEPRGEFGHVKQEGKGRGVYSYGGASNKKGSNALGEAMNKVGEKSGYPNRGKQKGGGGRHA